MKVTLIAGLPGSGKTTLLQEFADEGASVVDDLVSLDVLPRFAEGPDWLAIADVNFCRPAVREACLRELTRRYGACEVEWIFFANDPEACTRNAIQRADGRQVLVDIDTLSRSNAIPDGAAVRPVFQAPLPSP